MQLYKHYPMPGTEVAQRLDFWWFFQLLAWILRGEAVISPGSLFSVFQWKLRPNSKRHSTAQEVLQGPPHFPAAPASCAAWFCPASPSKDKLSRYLLALAQMATQNTQTGGKVTLTMSFNIVENIPPQMNYNLKVHPEMNDNSTLGDNIPGEPPAKYVIAISHMTAPLPRAAGTCFGLQQLTSLPHEVQGKRGLQFCCSSVHSCMLLMQVTCLWKQAASAARSGSDSQLPNKALHTHILSNGIPNRYVLEDLMIWPS